MDQHDLEPSGWSFSIPFKSGLLFSIRNRSLISLRVTGAESFSPGIPTAASVASPATCAPSSVRWIVSPSRRLKMRTGGAIRTSFASISPVASFVAFAKKRVRLMPFS